MVTITPKAADEIKLSLLNPDAQGLIIRFAIDETYEGFEYLMGLMTGQKAISISSPMVLNILLLMHKKI